LTAIGKRVETPEIIAKEGRNNPDLKVGVRKDLLNDSRALALFHGSQST